MGLVRCKICGGSISESARACPHCGETSPHPIRLPKKKELIAAVLAFVVIAVIGSFFQSCSSQRRENKENERRANELMDELRR
jgi:hypothetical protein